MTPRILLYARIRITTSRRIDDDKMSEKIVLVDDDRNITTSVSMALEAEGFTVKIFNDGEAGLEGISHESRVRGSFDPKMSFLVPLTN